MNSPIFSRNSAFSRYLEQTQTLVAQIDANGRLQEWNPAFERMKTAHQKPASKMAERLMALIRDLEIKVEQQVLKNTVSLGIAEYRIGEENWEELLNRADLALYQSKENGRDRLTVSECS